MDGAVDVGLKIFEGFDGVGAADEASLLAMLLLVLLAEEVELAVALPDTVAKVR